jgi:outer membrane protein assembly factor BamB
MKSIARTAGFLALAAITITVLTKCSSSPASKKAKTVEIGQQNKISQWRPENRTGVSSETGLLKSWPQKGPELIWSVKTLPKGYSSVSFGNNLIYVTGNEDKNDFLVALDPAGNIKWKTMYGTAWNQSYPESRCTPTVEGERVYVTSGSGEVVCFNGLNGEIIWSQNASQLYKGTFGEWGIAESLIIDGEKLYFTPGGTETTMIALDKNTGSLIWKSASINDSPSYVSPLLVERNGIKMIVNVLLRNVIAVDASDGTILWKIDHTEALDSRKSKAVWGDAPLIKCVTPLYYDGKIYVTGGYEHGGMMLKMAEDCKSASVEWTDEVLDVHHGGVVLLNGYIYGSNWLSNSNGNWCCIDWNTGKKMYEEHWKCKGSVIAADGMLYVYDERSGFVGLVKPNPEKFDLVSSFKVTDGSGPHWAHPVIHNGNLFIRHGNALMVYNIKMK